MGQKILVVEDNELNLKLFCDLLRAHGYETEPVRDGREALERARAFAPDLVVMDIQMPHISGLELIEQMKADDELRRTPIMAVTAYAAKGDEERIRDAGAEGYVSKPISLIRFIEAVSGLLTAAAEREEEEEEEEEEEPEAAASEAQEPAEPEGEAPSGAAEEVVPLERHSRESGNPDGGGSDEASPHRHPGEGRDPDDSGEWDEEGKVDPGLRRDDAGPKGDTP